MDNRSIFDALEEKFLTYRDLRSVAIAENGAPMVDLGASSAIKTRSSDPGMRDYTGDAIFVRAPLVEKLVEAQTRLTERFAGAFLEVVYGYRHLDIQTAKFHRIEAEIAAQDPSLSGEALREAVHRFVAVPEVAGHPTGGAVDLHIVDAKGKAWDMGTGVRELVKESYVHYPNVNPTAWHNRQLLRECMLHAGFAPFDGEWWHFSYGDREWAKYYGKPSALFSQIEFRSVGGPAISKEDPLRPSDNARQPTPETVLSRLNAGS